MTKILQHMNRIKKAIKDLLAKGAVLVDLRTCHEFVGRRIPGAVNIPEEDLPRQLEEVRSWKKPLIVFSRYDRSNDLVVSRLEQQGIEAIDGGDVEEMENILANLHVGDEVDPKNKKTWSAGDITTENS